MRNPDTIERARYKVRTLIMTEGLSEQQRTLFMGMLTALVWACGGESSTMDRLLSGEPIAPGQTMPIPNLSKLGGSS